MSDERDSGTSSILLSFLLGGLTGAALALLYAPRPGRETREYLADKLHEGAERSRGLRDDAVSKGREFLDEAGDYLERRKERLAAAVEAGRQVYREEKDKPKAKG